MSISKFIAGAVIILAAAFGSSALAAPAAVLSAAYATTGDTTSTPIGHADFCRSHRDECSPNAHLVELVALNERSWQFLLLVNATYNERITPVTDQELYQVAERWAYPDGAGDCEDIALAKRRELIAAGWPASTLLMAVVREPNGNGHAVLMVRTDRGDLVLDNQDGLVKVWSDTPYHFLKRQSQADQGKWVDILDDRAVIVAAAQ